MVRIYALKCPIEGQVVYVGITTWTLRRRLSNHVYLSKVHPNRKLYQWIGDLLDRGLKPEIILLEETERPEREYYWLRKYRNDGYELLNVRKPRRTAKGRLPCISPES